MSTMMVRHDQLRNGDVTYVEGYAFIVTNLRTVRGWTSMHSTEPAPMVVRYEGVCAEPCDISRTGYNGGTYGARVDVLVPIRARA